MDCADPRIAPNSDTVIPPPWPSGNNTNRAEAAKAWDTLTMFAKYFLFLVEPILLYRAFNTLLWLLIPKV